MNALPAALFLALATVSFAQNEVATLVEFRDSLKPGSREAAQQNLHVVAWKDSEKALVRKHLNYIHERAPQLIARAAMGDTVRLYRSQLKNYAMAGRQLITIDDKTFAPKSLDWSRRIFIHELVRTANHFHATSNSKEFRSAIEPRLKTAQAILKANGLTPTQAAGLPFDERRKKVDMQIRKDSGLPSIQAAINLSACLAETASLWIDGKFKYNPPGDVLPSLNRMVKEAPTDNKAVAFLLSGESSFSKQKFEKALLELEAAVSKNPSFYQAIALRGHTLERLGNLPAAAADLKKSTSLISPYEHGYQFYASEADRLAKAAK